MKTLKNMENPATWNDDVKLVHKTICDYNGGLTGGVIGYSLPKLIEIECIVPLRKQIKKLERQVRNANAKRIAEMD